MIPFIIGPHGGRLGDVWARLRDSFVFLPALMVLFAILFAIGMVYLDGVLQQRGVDMAWVTTLSSSGARSILSTLAGCMATIVGVVFSIVPVAMQLAASQFGPHAMRGFLSDRGSQIALGTFSGVFTYSLVVLVTGRSGNHGFVPYAATYMGVLLGISAIGVLIFYINHITRSMRSESVINSLARDLTAATDTVFPAELGAATSGERSVRTQLSAAESQGRPICAEMAGYLRRVNEPGLLHLACRYDLLIRVEVRPGDFVLEDVVLATAFSRERMSDAAAKRLASMFVVGERRTPEQDIAYALQQLTEVAIRSLSPGIFAPFVAIPAIDHIGAGLARLAARKMPALERVDEKGVLRVEVTRGDTLSGLARAALRPIAHAGADQAEVMARLVEVANLVRLRAQEPEDRVALEALGREIEERAAQSLDGVGEQALVEAKARQSRRWTLGGERLTS